MNLDFNNPAIQVAFIAAVATIVTAFVSLVTALVTAFVSLFNHMFEARAKRLEKIKDIRSEYAQSLLEGIAEMHSNVLYHLQSLGFAKADFIFLLVNLEKLPLDEKGDRFKAFLDEAPERIKKNEAAKEAIHVELRKVTHYFTPKLVSSFFWFPRPLQLKGKVEKLVGECSGVYYLIIAEFGAIHNFEEELALSPYPTKELSERLLKSVENEFLDEWRGKTFKTVVAVQRLLAPHVR